MIIHLIQTSPGCSTITAHLDHIPGTCGDRHTQWYDEVGDRIRGEGQCRFLLQTIADHQRFVLNGIHQTTRLIEQQIQGTLERDAIHVDTDQLRCRQTFRFDGPCFHRNVDPMDSRNMANDFCQGNIMKMQGDFLSETRFNLQFTFGAVTIVGSIVLLAFARQFFPCLRIRMIVFTGR